MALKRLDGPADFGAAWGGIASVQLGLPVVWTEAAQRRRRPGPGGGLDGGGPGRLAGLAGRGAIAPGQQADFCVFAPDETSWWTRPLRQRHPVTPYAGQTLRGVVRQTWLAGAPVGPGERRGWPLVRGGRCRQPRPGGGHERAARGPAA